MKYKMMKALLILFVVIVLFSVADKTFHLKDKAIHYIEQQTSNKIDDFFESNGF